MRTKFSVNGFGRVTIAYDDVDHGGERRTRTFTAPEKFGYVREILDNGDVRQVCDKLCRYGSALMCEEKYLLATIKREYKALRQFENRPEGDY